MGNTEAEAYGEELSPCQRTGAGNCCWTGCSAAQTYRALESPLKEVLAVRGAPAVQSAAVSSGAEAAAAAAAVGVAACVPAGFAAPVASAAGAAQL